MILRFAGHAHAQLSVCPSPHGSALSRRAIWLPACVHAPANIQQPDDVLPSSRSNPKPETCSPAFASTFVLSVGSIKSTSALPLYSIANSSADGLCGILYGHVRFTIGSGNAPPSFSYKVFM